MANRSASGFQNHNKQVLMKGLQVHVKGVVQPDLIKVLTKVAKQIVDSIDAGNFEIPIYTGNLKDATGVGVYADGVLHSFLPTKTATKKQKMGSGRINRYFIDGSEFLQATMQLTTQFDKGVWFVIFSAVPYAYRINAAGSPLGRGQGFFRRTHEEALREILAGLRPIAESVTATPTML